MRRLVLAKAIILTACASLGAAHAAGIPDRVAALEKEVADLQQKLTALQAEINGVDQNAGLLRSSTQHLVWNGTAMSPQPQQFSGRTLVVAVVVPDGSGIPGNGAFAIAQGSTVRYFDCAQFAVSASGMSLSGAGPACPSGGFTVTYLYAGPKL